MQTGITSTGDHHSFLFSGNEYHDSSSQHSLQRKEDGVTCTQDLDVDQMATATFLAQEGKAHSTDEDPYVDDFDAPLIPRTTSVPFIMEPVSVSPAAMFLTAFSSTPSTSTPDGEGQVVSGYTFGSVVGYGAFSTIRRAYSHSGGVVAVKIIRRSDLSKQGNAPLARKLVQREAAVWSTLSHEHILPLFSVEHTAHAHYFFTLFCPAGSLFDILKRDGRPALPQDDVGMMFRQVVRGLRYLHEIALYVHRDIKLENVLVDEMGVCRIGDFGMTRKAGEVDEEEGDLSQEQAQEGGTTVHRAVSLAVPSSRKPRASLHVQFARHNTTRHRNSTNSTHPPPTVPGFCPGSLPYAAPELLLPQTLGSLRPHPSQDIWALGVLLYTLLTGRLPFMDSFEPRLQMKILKGELCVVHYSSTPTHLCVGVYDVPPGIGHGAERVLQGCLDRSVANRWTISMVDEVGWGIGWGSEGDDVTPAESDEEFESCHSSSSPCQSNTFPENPEWQQEKCRSRPSFEVASHRSTSSTRRSLSRASMTPSRSSSKGSILGRSISRHSPLHSPSLSALNSAILGDGTNSGPSSDSSPFNDSALIVSPYLRRGRRLRRPRDGSPSRSPSPTPATPTDSRLSVSVEMGKARSDDFEPDASRGRKRHNRGVRPDRLYSPGVDDAGFELPVLDETEDWTELRTPGKRSGSAPWRSQRHLDIQRDLRSHSCDRHASEEKRPGSSPPSSHATWPTSGGNSLGIFVRSRSGPKTSGGETFLSAPKPTSTLSRSRSAEYGQSGEMAYLHQAVEFCRA
jgi:MAP/microtubule affinity-regulating kinase